MTSVFKPLKSVNSLILVGIMASMGLAATAQTVAPVQPAPSATAARCRHAWPNVRPS
jgi:protein CpxP